MAGLISKIGKFLGGLFGKGMQAVQAVAPLVGAGGRIASQVGGMIGGKYGDMMRSGGDLAAGAGDVASRFANGDGFSTQQVSDVGKRFGEFRRHLPPRFRGGGGGGE
jgi:hypothetical protein